MATGKVSFFLEVEDKNATSKLKSFDQKLDSTVAKVEKLNKKKLNQLANEEKKVADKTNNIAKNADKAKSSLSKMDAVKFTLVSRATGAVTNALFDATRNAVGFTFQMDKLKAVTSGTEPEMVSLKKEILDLSRNTTKTTSDIAETSIELGKLGFNAQETKDSLESIVKTAEATGEPLQSTGFLISVIAKQFGFSADKISEIGDKVTVAANKSAAGVEDLLTTFKYVGPPASALGVDLDELIAVMMSLRDSGLGASQMGTSLRFVLTNLAAPTDTVKTALKQAGIEAFDSQGKFIGLTKFLEQLKDGLKNLTEQQRLQIEADIGGKRALSALTSLTGEAGGKVDNYTKALKNSIGASNEASKAMRENLVAQLNSLQGSLEAVIIAIIGSFVGKALILLVKKLRNTANMISLFLEGINSIIGKAGEFVDSIGKMIFGQEEWKKVTEVLDGVLGTVLTTISLVTSGLALYKSALLIASVTTDVFSASLRFLNSSLFKTLGIVGLVLLPFVALFKLFNSNQGFHDAVINGFQKIKEIIEKIMPALQNLWTSLKENLIPIFEQIAKFVTDKVIPAFSQIFDVLINKVIPAFSQIFDVLINKVIPAIAAELMPILQNLWSFFQESILPILQSLWEILQIVGQIFFVLAKTIIEGFVIPTIKFLMDLFKESIPVYKSIWEAVKQVGSLMMELGKIVASFLGPILQVVTGTLQNYLLPAFISLTNFVSKYVVPIIQKLSDIFTKVLKKAFENINNFLQNYLLPAFISLTNFVSKYVVPVIQRLADIFTKVLKKAFENINNFLQNVIIPTLNSLSSFISKYVVPVIQRLADVFQKTLKKALDFIKKPLGFLKGLFDDITGAIKRAVNWIQQLADKVGAVGDKIGGFFDKINPFKSGKSFDLGITEQRAVAFSYGSGMGNLQGRALSGYGPSSRAYTDNRRTTIHVNSVEEANKIKEAEDQSWKLKMQKRGNQ